MALFRFHRSDLLESLKTTVIIEDIYRLCEFLECSRNDLKIKPYPDDKNNFDPRIGWYTYIVLKKEENEKILEFKLSTSLETNEIFFNVALKNSYNWESIGYLCPVRKKLI